MKRFVINTFLLYILLVGLFTAAMYIAYSIPSEKLKSHVAASTPILTQEGYHPDSGFAPRFTCRDNFTDTWMMLICFEDTTDGKFENFAKNSHYFNEDFSDVETGSISLLKKSAEGNTGGLQRANYGRYWHGYLLPLKISLLFTDYAGIRVINCVLQALLLAAIVILIWKRLPHPVTAAFLLTLIFLHIYVVPLSLQYSTCFYITYISLLLLLLIPALRRTLSAGALTFFTIGAVTSFMDFLTTPTLTLCIPAAIILYGDDDSLRKSIAWIAMWFAGYTILWATKWVEAAAITGSWIWGDVFSSIGQRTMGEIVNSSLSFPTYILSAIMLAGLGVMTLQGLRALRRSHNPSEVKSYFYLLIISAVVPAWYAMLNNHTTIHFYFTWRALGGPLLCFLMYEWSLLRLKFKR